MKANQIEDRTLTRLLRNQEQSQYSPPEERVSPKRGLGVTKIAGVPSKKTPSESCSGGR